MFSVLGALRLWSLQCLVGARWTVHNDSAAVRDSPESACVSRGPLPFVSAPFTRSEGGETVAVSITLHHPSHIKSSHTLEPTQPPLHMATPMHRPLSILSPLTQHTRAVNARFKRPPRSDPARPSSCRGRGQMTVQHHRRQRLCHRGLDRPGLWRAIHCNSAPERPGPEWCPTRPHGSAIRHQPGHGVI